MDPEDAPPELHLAAWPYHVLTSMVKMVDVVVYEVLRDHAENQPRTNWEDLLLGYETRPNPTLVSFFGHSYQRLQRCASDSAAYHFL